MPDALPAPYTINTAIDGLLKKEFDVCRENGTAHYIIQKYSINAIPAGTKIIHVF